MPAMRLAQGGIKACLAHQAEFTTPVRMKTTDAWNARSKPRWFPKLACLMCLSRGALLWNVG